MSLVKSRVRTVEPVAIPHTCLTRKPGRVSVVTIENSINLDDLKSADVRIMLADFSFTGNGNLMTTEFDHQFKILIVGDTGVGKSSLILRLCDDSFSPSQSSTIGVDFKVKIMRHKEKTIKLNVWDTYATILCIFIHQILSAGQERFRTLTSSYYRGAHGVILVYDATNRSSFESLEYWVGEIRQHANTPGLVILLVGSKLDRPATEVKVSRTEGEVFAIEHSMLFFEISSKNRVGVDECFSELLESILENPALVAKADANQSPRRRRLDTVTSTSCSSC